MLNEITEKYLNEKTKCPICGEYYTVFEMNVFHASKHILDRLEAKSTKLKIPKVREYKRTNIVSK